MTKYLIRAAIVAIVAWGALAFGAVYPWAYLPLLAACVVAGLLGIASGRRVPGSSSNRAVLAGFAAVLAAGLMQLVPLPFGALNVLSPAADTFLRQYDLSYGDAAAHSLSIDSRATILGLLFLSSFLIFLIGLLRAFAQYGVRRLVPPLIVLGVLLAVIAVVQKVVLGDHAYMGMKIYGFWEPQSKLVVPYGPYVNRNHFAGWMLMGIPLALGYLCAQLAKRSGRDRADWRTQLLWFSSPEGGRVLLVGLGVIAMALSVTMSMSRSGMACLAIAAIVVSARLLLSLRSSGGRLAAVGLFVVLIGVPVLWLGLDATVDRFASDSVGSIDTRVRAWRDTRSIIRDFPLTGTGLNTFRTAMVQYQTGSRDVHFRESHNDYLQLMAEGGILLALPILATGFLFVRAVRRRFRDDTDPTISWIRFGAVAGILAIAVQSLVEFSLQMPGNAAFFVVLLAIALHHPPQTRRPAV